jgi:hypothetical protein
LKPFRLILLSGNSPEYEGNKMENMSPMPETASRCLGLEDILDRSRAIFEKTKELIDNGDMHREQITMLAAESEQLVDDSTELLGRLKRKNADLENEIASASVV